MFRELDEPIADRERGIEALLLDELVERDLGFEPARDPSGVRRRDIRGRRVDAGAGRPSYGRGAALQEPVCRRTAPAAPGVLRRCAGIPGRRAQARTPAPACGRIVQPASVDRAAISAPILGQGTRTRTCTARQSRRRVGWGPRATPTCDGDHRKVRGKTATCARPIQCATMTPGMSQAEQSIDLVRERLSGACSRTGASRSPNVLDELAARRGARRGPRARRGGARRAASPSSARARREERADHDAARRCRRDGGAARAVSRARDRGRAAHVRARQQERADSRAAA